MSFRIFKINEFLESVCKECESIAVNRNIALHLVINTKIEDEIFGDRERLRQVLSNLISNAINYNRPGGEVELFSERIADGIRISVKDTGVGIPSEHLPRIFERFYRVDSDRSRALGGTGLGLAIVKHIIEAHGSRIDVDSKVGGRKHFPVCFEKQLNARVVALIVPKLSLGTRNGALIDRNVSSANRLSKDRIESECSLTPDYLSAHAASAMAFH